MSAESATIPDQANPSQLLDEVLENSHPLMVEGFFLAAVPYWYDLALFAAMRQRADDRDEGIVERLSRYSFIPTLEDLRQSGDAYTVHPVQRAMLNERWIAQDPAAYREAHRRALAYWEAHPDPDPDVQARTLLYHRLFVDAAAATETLIGLFRAYSADRQLAAIERILATVSEARHYLLLLGDPLPAGFDDLLLHLKTRLGQLRGIWDESLVPLEQLRATKDLPPRLLPYVIRAHGDALAHTGDYVAAIADYEEAQTLFDRQAKEGVDPANIEAERGYTLIALGDAYAGLARAAAGRAEAAPAGSSDSLPRNALRFVLAAPLAIYLSRRLGRQVWHPRYWGLVSDLDWIIARLIATGAAYYRQADPILRAHGRRSEGVIADQKLAALYLELGDAHQAEALYTPLLDESAALLSEYGRATALLGLGGALLAQGRPEEALPRLEAALPLLRRFEDATGEAQADLAQADALRDLGRPTDALLHYEAALRLYEKQGDRIGATQAGERLDALARDEGLLQEGRAAAFRASEAIAPRHYPVRYRHPAIVNFQRAMVILLVIWMAPILVIRLEPGAAFEPDITFRAGPLLDNTADFNPDLSQTMQALRLAPPPDPNVLWLVAVLLGPAAAILFYLALSALLGLLVIIRTPLSSVQTTSHADVVRLDGKSIRTGEGASRREVAWADAQERVRADVLLVRDRVRNESQAAVASPDERIIISGQTGWYESLLERIDRYTPSQARRTDVSFSALRSPMGALYLLTHAALVLIAVLIVVDPHTLFTDLAGTAYSVADLYPYLFLGLFLPPMTWFVIQPLRQRRRLDPGNVRLALIIGGVGLALAALRILTRFRPWLTVPDIYPTLAAIIMVGSAAITLLRAPRPAGERLPLVARGLVAAATICVLALMGAQLWREVASYHYLVQGNDLRDRALGEAPEDRDAALQRAAEAYGRAQAIADTPLLGIPGRAALRGGPGLPAVSKITWFDAANSYAAMRSELGDDPNDILAYYETLLAETQDPQAYVGRALALLRLGGRQSAEAQNSPLTLDRTAYLTAVEGFTRAIEEAPKNAKYYLWRGFARHALGATDLAEGDYQRALEITGMGALNRTDCATALTGLGWVDFGLAKQQQNEAERKRLAQSADERFRQAIAADPKLDDAWLGQGYAFYTLRDYDGASEAWRQADNLRPNDPAVLLSLGALYWRMGTLVEGYVDENGKDKAAKEYCSEQYTLDQRATAEARLKQAVAYLTRALDLAGLDDKAKARTYSSLGQIYYLMQTCPDLDAADMLQRSVQANDRAREIDPTSASRPLPQRPPDP